MLALAAENDQQKRLCEQLLQEKQALEKDLAEQILKNVDLTRENAALNAIPKEQVSRCESDSKFSVEKVRECKIRDNFKYYTGFVYVQFMCIFNFLVPNELECPFSWKRTVSSVKSMKLQDQLLLTLMKLRLNHQFKHLGHLFNISPQDAGALFREWINYMFFRFGSVPIWPERDILVDNMPPKYREDFPTTMIILDGTELKVERQAHCDHRVSVTQTTSPVLH